MPRTYTNALQHDPAAKSRDPSKPGAHAAATLASLFKSAATRTPIERALQDSALAHYDRDKLAHWAKSAVAPETTETAAGLVRELWADFLDLLRDESIFPSVPAYRFDFDANGAKVQLPRGEGRGNLAGQWTSQTGAIPVASSEIGLVDLEPRRLKIISVFSKELATRSVPEIAEIVRRQIIEDTAEVVDSSLLDSNARTGARPAGLGDATEAGAANSVAATSVTDPTDLAELMPKMLADLRALKTRLVAVRAHKRGVWIAHPNLWERLADLRDQTGKLYFVELESNAFRRFPIMQSANCPEHKLVFIADNALAIGQGVPRIDASEDATLHMHSAPNEDLSGAAPLRSLFQTETMGIRLSLPLDWRILRPGAVQTLSDLDNWGS